MSWHRLMPGESVGISAIRLLIENRLGSGHVKDVPTKLIYLEEILDSGYQELTYSPIGEGWGKTPLNPHCWVAEGKRRVGYAKK